MFATSGPIRDWPDTGHDLAHRGHRGAWLRAFRARRRDAVRLERALSRRRGSTPQPYGVNAVVILGLAKLYPAHPPAMTEGRAVGHVISSEHPHLVGAVLARAHVGMKSATEGVAISIPAQPSTVARTGLFDPEGLRLQS